VSATEIGENLNNIEDQLGDQWTYWEANGQTMHLKGNPFGNG
jgi:hypothetical protein